MDQLHMINTHDQPHFIWRDQKCFSRPISLPIVGYPHCRERPVSPVVWGVHSRQAQGSNVSPALAGFYHWTTWEAHQIFICLTVACGIQLPDQGSDRGPPAPRVQRPSLWTSREILWTEELGVLWSMGSQRIEHNLATKRPLEFTFIIKDYSILRYYLDHLQSQANQFEGLFFSFFADNIKANFQPHGYNPSGALPKQKPLELLQSTALSMWTSHSIRAFWNLKNQTWESYR